MEIQQCPYPGLGGLFGSASVQVNRTLNQRWTNPEWIQRCLVRTKSARWKPSQKTKLSTNMSGKIGSPFVRDWFGPEEIILIQDWFGHVWFLCWRYYLNSIWDNISNTVLAGYPLDIFGTVVGESPDCLLLSGTVIGENPDHVCWVPVLNIDCNSIIEEWKRAKSYNLLCDSPLFLILPEVLLGLYISLFRQVITQFCPKMCDACAGKENIGICWVQNALDDPWVVLRI